MSVHKVEMFTIVCDHCKKDIGTEQEFSCWNDESYAESNAMESDWIKEGESHYCTDCYEYDDEDKLVLNPERKNKFEKK